MMDLSAVPFRAHRSFRTLYRPALLAVFAVTPLSGALAQGTVTTPFALSLSPGSVEALIGGVSSLGSPSGQIQTQLPDQTLSSPTAITLAGIRLNLEYAFAPPTPTANLNEWILTSTSLAATLTVASIGASEVIQETVGGTTLTITVEISCTDAVLELAPGSTQASGTIEFGLNGGVPWYQLTSFSANWAPSAWRITSLSCNGPPIVAQTVAQAAQAQLVTINPFLGTIETAIQNQLNAASNTPLAWNLSTGGPASVTLSLNPQTLVFGADGSGQTSGLASFDFGALNPSTPCGAQIDPAAAPQPASQDTLAFPLEAVSPLLQCAYYNGSLSYGFTSRQFTAFQSLLGSWFEELFVWPDLEQFSSSSVFYFDLFPYVAPTLGALTAGSGNALSFELDTALSLSVFAPIGGNPLPQHYLDFLTRATGPVNLLVQGGKAAFTQTLSSLPVQVDWDPIYVENYHPDESIWTSIVAGYLQSYLANPGLSYALPTWQAVGAFSLQVESAEVSGSDLQMGLKIQSLKTAP